MAARINRRHQDMIREKIRVSQLINSLQNHVDGENDLKSTQVDAAKYLISQAIGTPSSGIELSGPDGGPIEALPFRFIDEGAGSTKEG